MVIHFMYNINNICGYKIMTRKTAGTAETPARAHIPLCDIQITDYVQISYHSKSE